MFQSHEQKTFFGLLEMKRHSDLIKIGIAWLSIVNEIQDLLTLGQENN